MKASVYIAASIDGFIAREDGDIEWLHNSGEGTVHESEDYGYKEFSDSVDVIIMGRKSFEKVLTFGEWSYASKQVVVLSSSNIELPQELPNTVESSSLPPQELLETLGNRGFRHAYIDGGLTIQRFLKAQVINEITITRIPRVLGSGIPLFESSELDIRLKHISTNSFEDGLVQSKYAVISGGV